MVMNMTKYVSPIDHLTRSFTKSKSGLWLNTFLPRRYSNVQLISIGGNGSFCRECSSSISSYSSKKEPLMSEVEVNDCVSMSTDSVLDRFREEVTVRTTEFSRRLEKIKVRHRGGSHDRNITVEVNNHYSTPLDVARHIGRDYSILSAVARIEGCKFIDMNQPISENSNEVVMDFVWFKNTHQKNPMPANKTLWNTACFLSGSILSDLFKDNIGVYPWLPSVDLSCESGVFGYEFELVQMHGEKDEKEIKWNASDEEISFLNKKLRSLIYSKPPIYGIDVNRKSAENIFGIESSKNEAVDQILAKFNSASVELGDYNKVRLYCCGDLVEMHPGPLLPSVDLIGQIEITSLYPLNSRGVNGGVIHRIEGVALPTVLPAHHWPWSVITSSAKDEAKTKRNGDECTSVDRFVQWYFEEFCWKMGVGENKQR